MVEITTDMITQFGLMNKVSTGRQWLDLLVCLAIPLILKTWMPKLYEQLEKLWKPSNKPAPKMFMRRIEFYHKGGYYYWGNKDEPPNNVLQLAILAYLNRQTDLSEQLEDAMVDLAEQPLKRKKSCDNGDDDDCDSEYGDNQVQRLGVSIAPPSESWVAVEPGLEFMREDEFSANATEGTKRKLKTIFYFRTAEPAGNKRIDTFIQKAFQYYKDQRKEKVDRSRYMYVPVSKEGSSGDKTAERTVYKRYKLSEEKTFSSLFHPERDHILKLIKDFKAKTGKFAIPGYPQKLGFLLHGPPGTGKTTFIKALAQATGRNIISVPLAKIRTNQELMDVMFEQLYRIEDQEIPMSMNFSKVLFVMEDVDAACRVVQKRTPEPLQTMLTTLQLTSAGDVLMRTASTKVEELPAAALDSAILHAAEASAASRDCATAGRSEQMTGGSPFQCNAGDAKSGKDQGKDSKEGKDSHCQEGQKRGEAKAGTTGNGTAGLMGGGTCGTLSMGGMGGMGGLGLMGGMGGYMGMFQSPDELNLAGLLNVLDGVVDTPDRLVVMTTNHPEKLDPALVRPGRINKKIYMGRMKVTEALQMVRHYFLNVTAADEEAVRHVFVDEKWSPAELESMCAEYDSVGELVQALAAQRVQGAVAE